MTPSNTDSKSSIFISYTGESICLILFRCDFIDYVKSDTPIKDVTKVN